MASIARGLPSRPRASNTRIKAEGGTPPHLATSCIHTAVSPRACASFFSAQASASWATPSERRSIFHSFASNSEGKPRGGFAGGLEEWGSGIHDVGYSAATLTVEADGDVGGGGYSRSEMSERCCARKEDGATRMGVSPSSGSSSSSSSSSEFPFLFFFALKASHASRKVCMSTAHALVSVIVSVGASGSGIVSPSSFGLNSRRT
mmetsp:Transcript_3169/g.6072  ORF Transcript_3169/g.6072 Transcript_3169/m.6072 type:complete len:205 (-) Transcript_3169:803-1417(-)